jgi:hypothetical protein
MKRTSIGFFLVLVVLVGAVILPGKVPTAAPPARSALPSDNLPARQRIHSIRSYMVYYGKNQGDRLAAYDLAILQPDTLNREDLAALHKQGTLVVAYLSIGEVETERPWYTDGRFDPAWVLGKNENWGSYFIDAGKPGWQKLMLDLAGEYLAYGFDGIFLDTVDTVDSYPETKAGMIGLIHALRQRYPDALLVQNRGFNVIQDVSADLDALMFEGFTTDYNFQTHEYMSQENNQLAGELYLLKSKTGLVILALDYAPPDNPGLAARAVRIARGYEFVPAVSVINLDQIPDYGVDLESPPDLRVRWVHGSGDPEEVTLDVMIENVGRSTAPLALVHLYVDGSELEKVGREFPTGEGFTWKVTWAKPKDGSVVRVVIDDPKEANRSNNAYSWTFRVADLPMEPLLPPDKQLRRKNPNTPDMVATYLAKPPVIDGDLSDWQGLPCTDVNTAAQVSYGDVSAWQGPQDLSGRVCYAWDEKDLYVAFTIKDDIIVQRFTGTALWQGDHVEMWFDTKLQSDFSSNTADDDDFQLGISPGDFGAVAPDIYIWTPNMGPEEYRGMIEYKVVKTADGYQCEMKIPAKVLRGLRLAPGHAIGASFEPSDTDTPGGAQQEMMMSTAPKSSKEWGNPQNWNNLVFEKK